MTKQTRAVFFDVDFTLIYPGPTFDAVGYKAFSRRHGLRVDTGRFESAVITASRELDVGEDASYRAELFVRYARRVLEEMGGTGPGIDACAREIYEEWAVCRHFSLYDDVKPALRQLHEKPPFAQHLPRVRRSPRPHHAGTSDTVVRHLGAGSMPRCFSPGIWSSSV